jgi:hypothetical protein
MSEHFKRVTVRKGSGKCHPALLPMGSSIPFTICQCPGLQSGTLNPGLKIVAEGHQDANCRGRKTQTQEAQK